MTGFAAAELSQIPMSPALGAALAKASDAAGSMGSAEVMLEHLLIALCDDPDAAGVLDASHIDIHRLRSEAIDFLMRSVRPGGPPSQHLAVSHAVRRILEAAAAAARGGKRRDINGAIVLAAIVGDGKSAAAQMLQAQGLTFDEAIRALQAALNQPSRDVGAAADDVLARARERVQSRSAPSLREIMQDLPRPVSPPPIAAPAPAYPAAPPYFPEPIPQPRAPAPPSAPAPAMPELKMDHAPSFEPAPVPPMEVAPAASPIAQEKPALQSAAQPPAPSAPATSVAESAAVPAQPAAATPAPQQLPSQSGSGDYVYPTGQPMPRPAPPPPVMPVPEAPRQVAFDIGGGPRPAMPPPMPPPIPRGGGFAAPSAPGPSAPGPSAPLPSAPFPSAPGLQRSPLPAPSIGAAGPPLGASPLPSPQPPAKARREGPAKAGLGQLAENIPRKMRAGVSERVEVRIAKAHAASITDDLDGHGAAWKHDVTVTQAMSVRLRAPEGGFFIETASPETQWIENHLGITGGDDYASWRFLVTPQRRGWSKLQIIISARTIGADGLAAETALPDQMIEVKVRTNFKRTLARWTGWILAAVAGGGFAKFGEGAFEMAKDAAQKFLN